MYVLRTWQNLVILKLFGDYIKIFQALQDFSTNLFWTLYFQTGFGDLGQISRPLEHLKDMNRTFFFLGMSMSGFILMTVWKRIIVFSSFNFQIKNYRKKKKKKLKKKKQEWKSNHIPLALVFVQQRHFVQQRPEATAK